MSLNTPPARPAQDISRFAGAGFMRAAADRVRGWPRSAADLQYASKFALSILDDIAAIADPVARHAALPAAKLRLHTLIRGTAEGPSALFRPRWTTTKNQ